VIDYVPDTDISNMAILPSSEVGGKTEAPYIKWRHKRLWRGFILFVLIYIWQIPIIPVHDNVPN